MTGTDAPAGLRIPFNRPTSVSRSLEYVAECARSGHISGGGPFGVRCEALLSEMLAGHTVLLTPSGSAALEMAALLLDLRSGDEVIMPSFTFPSAANAVVLRGARPVWIDVRPDTLNLDERLLPDLITPQTRAIIPTHYAGVACEMDEILRIASVNDVAVVEDNALGLCGTYRDRPLGTFGKLAALSFHETKNFSCGEGGALIVNDASLAMRAETIREKGTDRSRFLRGEVPQYSWQTAGSSWLLSDLAAAYLLGQLERREQIQSSRLDIWNRYATELAAWAQRQGIQLPAIPDGVQHPAGIFYLLLPEPSARDRFIAHMRAAGIATAHHYVPLHSSPFGLRLAAEPVHLPVTDMVSDRIVRLPLFTGMHPPEVDQVIAAACAFSA
jgi:dTDP-4-amino-4,6-dideoxygalactose transaminase